MVGSIARTGGAKTETIRGEIAEEGIRLISQLWYRGVVLDCESDNIAQAID